MKYQKQERFTEKDKKIIKKYYDMPDLEPVLKFIRYHTCEECGNILQVFEVDGSLGIEYHECKDGFIV